jgi:Hsp20/alpha crystallin family
MFEWEMAEELSLLKAESSLILLPNRGLPIRQELLRTTVPHLTKRMRIEVRSADELTTNITSDIVFFVLVAKCASDDPATQLSVERDFVGSAQFTRTVWLPRPVDASKISGKLSDGILTLRAPKAEERDVVTVDIE